MMTNLPENLAVKNFKIIDSKLVAIISSLSWIESIASLRSGNTRYAHVLRPGFFLMIKFQTKYIGNEWKKMLTGLV